MLTIFTLLAVILRIKLIYHDEQIMLNKLEKSILLDNLDTKFIVLMADCNRHR